MKDPKPRLASIMLETGVEVAESLKPNPNQIWKDIVFFIYSFDRIHGQLF